MQLTLYTDYSLRTLAYLSLNPNKSCTISEIADFYHISRNHLVKVVHNLSKAGFIASVRGKGGGLQLSKAPDQINLVDVIRQTEPNFHLAECFDSTRQTCTIEPICKLKGILSEALAQFMNVLENYTIADLLTENKGSVDWKALIRFDKEEQ